MSREEDLMRRIDADFTSRKFGGAVTDAPGYTEVNDQAPTHLLEDGATTEVIDPKQDEEVVEYMTDGASSNVLGGVMADVLGADAAEDVLGGSSLSMPFSSPLSNKDDLDHAIDMKQRQDAADRRDVPFVGVNPASWDRGVLGQTVLLKFLAGGDGPVQQIVFWPGDPRESCPVTVTIAPVLPLPTLSVSPLASIRWGTHGAFFNANIDIGTGFQLTLSASSVYVSAFLVDGSLADLNVAASIGFYAMNRTSPVFRTDRFKNLAGLASVDYTRPAFTSTIVGFERSDATASFSLTFLDVAGVSLGQHTIVGNSYLTYPITLPSFCATVRVTNNSAGAVSGTICYGMF